MIVLVPLFFLVAVIYSSVGLGGGSAYVALLALSKIPYHTIPSTALLLNIIVSAVGFYNYRKAGYFGLKILLPFVVGSIPGAFIGGLLPISEKTLILFLTVIIFLVALRMILLRRGIKAKFNVDKTTAYLAGLPAGLILGLVAGMLGIGGGIFLAPMLLLIGWADPKEAAATSAAFVLLNSISGLVAHSLRGTIDPNTFIPLAVAVFLGGQIGSRLGANKFSPLLLQKIFGMVLLIVSAKLWSKIL